MDTPLKFLEPGEMISITDKWINGTEFEVAAKLRREVIELAAKAAKKAAAAAAAEKAKKVAAPAIPAAPPKPPVT
jgi:hypothetical protein